MDVIIDSNNIWIPEIILEIIYEYHDEFIKVEINEYISEGRFDKFIYEYRIINYPFVMGIHSKWVPVGMRDIKFIVDYSEILPLAYFFFTYHIDKIRRRDYASSLEEKIIYLKERLKYINTLYEKHDNMKKTKSILIMRYIRFIFTGDKNNEYKIWVGDMNIYKMVCSEWYSHLRY